MEAYRAAQQGEQPWWSCQLRIADSHTIAAGVCAADNEVHRLAVVRTGGRGIGLWRCCSWHRQCRFGWHGRWLGRHAVAGQVEMCLLCSLLCSRHICIRHSRRLHGACCCFALA